MIPADPPPPAPAAEDLPGGPLRSERDGAGCLVGLGVLLLVPVVLILFWTWRDTLGSVFHLLHDSTWAHRMSIWAGPAGGSMAPGFVVTICLLGYCLLFWQWAAFRFGWKVFIQPPRLWAVSSAYFAAVIVTIMLITCAVADTFAAILSGTVWLSMVPAFFLMMTLRLRSLRKQAMLSPRERARKLAQEVIGAHRPQHR